MLTATAAQRSLFHPTTRDSFMCTESRTIPQSLDLRPTSIIMKESIFFLNLTVFVYFFIVVLSFVCGSVIVIREESYLNYGVKRRTKHSFVFDEEVVSNVKMLMLISHNSLAKDCIKVCKDIICIRYFPLVDWKFVVFVSMCVCVYERESMYV